MERLHEGQETEHQLPSSMGLDALSSHGHAIRQSSISKDYHQYYGISEKSSNAIKKCFILDIQATQICLNSFLRLQPYQAAALRYRRPQCPFRFSSFSKSSPHPSTSHQRLFRDGKLLLRLLPTRPSHPQEP